MSHFNRVPQSLESCSKADCFGVLAHSSKSKEHSGMIYKMKKEKKENKLTFFA